MAEVHLRRRHGVGLKVAKAAAQKVADDLAEEFGMQASWDGDVLRLCRTGADGELLVTRNG
ncbi:MAG: polyhydroxyalkanoic acid system family protein, partial [Quisquiliibacterium sp.]